jgi:Trp operon repressor
MDNKNYEAYINILNNDIETQKKEELLTLFVTDETLK